MNITPQISVVVCLWHMEREAPRTLHTLCAAYQTRVSPNDYEVLVVDCGAKPSIDANTVKKFGPNFRLMRTDDSPSPAASINKAVRECSAPLVMVCIDGARMLSPGVIFFTLAAFRAFGDTVVATLAWHLGPKIQQFSMLEGYDQVAEDRLLTTINWHNDGYELFQISTLAGSSKNGWFMPINESNCISLSREAYDALGGLDECFKTPGGGFLNLDFYRRACLEVGFLVILLGEGTFHQFHGGVSTNIPMIHPIRETFRQEYESLRGMPFVSPNISPIFIGALPPQAMPFVYHSMEMVRNNISFV